jgi:hypothetical protein
VTAVLRGIDDIAITSAEAMLFVRDTALANPRSAQKRIGPSGLGIACTARLVHVLAGDEEPGGDPRRFGWYPLQGTAMHALLEAGVKAHPMNQAVAQPRWITETRVVVGEIGGTKIDGSCDLFDIDSGTVFDWKLVVKNSMARYRAKGPGRQYRVQAHAYGRGFARLGYRVRTVADIFLPRDDELLIDDRGRAVGAYVWAEPYDESVVTAALDRCAGLLDLIEMIGVDDVLAMTSRCTDYFCPWCGGRPRTETVRELPV